MVMKISKTASQWKTILDMSREILPDMRIYFFPSNDDVSAGGDGTTIPAKLQNFKGIIAVGTDQGKTVVVQWMFPKSELDTDGIYECSRLCVEQVNTSFLSGVFRAAPNHHQLVLSLDDESQMRVRAYDGDFAVILDTMVNLRIPKEEKLNVLPPMAYNYAHVMESKDFSNRLQRISCIEGNDLWICVRKGALMFYAEGDYGNMRLIEPADDARLIKCNVEVYSRFDYKYLTYAARGQTLSPSVNIHLFPDLPIVIHYKVAGLGDVCWIITPKASEEDMCPPTWNDEETDVPSPVDSSSTPPPPAVAHVPLQTEKQRGVKRRRANDGTQCAKKQSGGDLEGGGGGDDNDDDDDDAGAH